MKNYGGSLLDLLAFLSLLGLFTLKESKTKTKSLKFGHIKIIIILTILIITNHNHNYNINNNDKSYNNQTGAKVMLTA